MMDARLHSVANARKNYYYIIHYKLLNDEDKYVPIRYQKFSNNAIYLKCGNTKCKAKISFKVLSPRIIEQIERTGRNRYILNVQYILNVVSGKESISVMFIDMFKKNYTCLINLNMKI